MRTDVLVDPSAMSWHSLGPGATFKLLRADPDSGSFAMILRIEEGGTFQSHYHLGSGEFLMLKGAMNYAGGVAKSGDYGFEANYAKHDATTADEELEMLFIGHGPIVFPDDAGKPEMILDCAALKDIAEGRLSMNIVAE